MGTSKQLRLLPKLQVALHELMVRQAMLQKTTLPLTEVENVNLVLNWSLSPTDYCS